MVEDVFDIGFFANKKTQCQTHLPSDGVIRLYIYMERIGVHPHYELLVRARRCMPIGAWPYVIVMSYQTKKKSCDVNRAKKKKRKK